MHSGRTGARLLPAWIRTIWRGYSAQGTRDHEAASRLFARYSARQAAERPPTNFVPLDLSAQANCDTGKGVDSIPGWVDEPNNYLIDFPSGEQSFRGVTFQIASAEENGHRVCIGVSSSPKYASKTQVPVHQPCRSFYLLHAGSGREATLGKLTIHYEDGSKQIEYMERGVNVGTFWAPQDLEFNNRYGALAQERMQVAWRGKSGLIENVGVWITSFEPHKSDAVIASLELESMETGSKWFVIGITLSNMPAFFLRGAMFRVECRITGERAA
jgi:hypothetical protein